jgi:tetratricopeptide (TPR) repeat protein
MAEKSMPFRFLATLLVWLWIIGLTAGGCAYRRSPQQDLLKTYRQKMEIQKAAFEKEDQKHGLSSELDAEGYERLGDRYLKQGNKDLAFIQYEKSLRMDPNRNHIRYRLGRLFMEKGLSQEAEKEFRAMLKINPKDPLPYEGIGRILFHSGNLEDAEKNFQQALKLKSDLWQAHHFLGIIYDRRGEFDIAVDAYRKAISFKPDFFVLYHNLGMSLFLRGDYEEAVNAFIRSLDLEPSNRRGLYNLALALSKLDRYEEAFETLRKGSEEASAHYHLGQIYMAEGKYEEAVGAFEKAIEARPVFYAEVHRNLLRARSVLNTFLKKGEETGQTEEER